MRRIEDEMNGMMSNFNQVFQQRGAICDSEGFYQHTGQCWSDAIQMIFLWTDGLKEVVQRRLATSIIDDTFVGHINDANLVNGRNLTGVNEQSLAKKFKKSATEYFKIVQHRFMRHYTTELGRRKMYCSTNVPEARYYSRLLKISGLLHTQGKNAINSEQFGKIENHRTSTGGFEEDITYLLYLYSLTFFNKTLEFHTSETLSSSTHDANAVFISIFKEGSSSGHAICFYTCGGQDFLYDDIYGPIPFNWRKFCLYIRGLISVNYSFKVFFTNCKSKKEALYQTEFYPVIRAEGVYTTYVGDELVIIEGNTYSDDSVDIKINDVMDEITTVYGIVNKNSASVENKGFQFERNARLNSDFMMFSKARSFIHDNDIISLKKMLQNPMFDVNTVDRDSTDENISLLIYAIKMNNLEAVNLLLQHPKIDVNRKIHNRFIDLGEFSVEFTPLTAALFYKGTSPQILKRLLEESSFNVNTVISDEGHRALHALIELHDVQGMIDRIHLLLTRPDLDINATMKDGGTALLYAYALQEKGLIDEFCRRGASLTFTVPEEDKYMFSSCRSVYKPMPIRRNSTRKN